MRADYEAPTDEEVLKIYSRLNGEAVRAGYSLNPDAGFARDLVRGIMINERRYGYGSCPCRLASDDRRLDLDIICPCDYRDADLADFGACYCALYVSGEVLRGEKVLGPVPERRAAERDGKKASAGRGAISSQLSVPVWRCVVCGYLCGRNEPPEVCPICKAKKERFERFI